MEQGNNYQQSSGQPNGTPQQPPQYQQAPQYQQVPPTQEQKGGKTGLIIAILVILILLTGGFFWIMKSGFLTTGVTQNNISMYNGRWVGSSTVLVPGDGTCVASEAVFTVANGVMTGTVSSEEYNVNVGASGQVTADGAITAGIVNDTTRTYGSDWVGQITGNTASGTWFVVENGCSGTWVLNRVGVESVEAPVPVAAPAPAPVTRTAPAAPVQNSVATYNGRWVGSSKVLVAGDGSCVGTNANFTLNGGVMSGTVTSPEYGVTVEAAGSVDANGNIKAGLVESTQTTTGSYWSGKINGSTASGTWESVVNGCSGTWTLARQ